MFDSSFHCGVAASLLKDPEVCSLLGLSVSLGREYCVSHFPFPPGKSCWQFWNKVLIHPSSFLSTRRRVVMCWPSLLRRWGYVWQAEQRVTLLLLLSDTRDSARSPHCLISAASNEAEPKEECGLRKEGNNFSSSHSSQSPCGSPCNGVGLLERGRCVLSEMV